VDVGVVDKLWRNFTLPRRLWLRLDGGHAGCRSERALSLWQREEVQEVPPTTRRGGAAEPGEAAAALHQLDGALVDRMMAFAARRFGEDFAEETAALLLDDARAPTTRTSAGSSCPG
jgi:hypothetical protein